MAQLKDLLVNGVSRLVGDVFLDKLNAPTTSAGVDFGLGTNGQVLKTNGNNIYWGKTDLSTEISGILPVTKGGTGIAYANNTGPAANLIFASDSNSAHTVANNDLAAPSFRALVAADLPTVPVTKGGTGITTTSWKNAIIAAGTSSATGNFNPIQSKSGALYSTGDNVTAKFGTLPVAQGGTGMVTAVNPNAVVISNSSNVTSAMQTIQSKSGAFYSTGTNVKPDFGILPAAQGGTGISTAAANTVFAGPVSGSNAAPEFRELQNLDMENISLSSQKNLIIFIQTTTDKTAKNQSFKIDSGDFNSVAYDLGGIKDKQFIVNLKFTYGLDTTLMNFNSGQSYLQFSFYDGDGTTLLNISGIRIASSSTGTIPLANSADNSPTHIILSPGQIIKGYLSNNTILLPYANSIFSSSLSKNGIMFNLGNNKSPNFPIVSECIGVRNDGSTLFFNNSCCTAMAVVSDQDLDIGSTVVFSTSSVGYVQKTTTASKRDAMIIVDPLICSCIYNPFNLDPNQSNIYYVAIKGIVPIQNASSTANIGNYFVNNNNGKTTNSSSFNNFTLGQIIANSGTRKLGSVTYQLTTSFVLAKLL